MSRSHTIWIAAVLLAACFGCEGAREHAHEGHEDDHGKDQDDGHDDHRKGHADHAGEVTISPEAAQRSGIALGKVERRALAGGVAIPAEVEFAPSSTAHVGPLVAGRITSVEVAVGDLVKRGQLLGKVVSGDASSARARLEQARARLNAAEASLKRQEQLAKEGIGAQRALIDAQANVDELNAEVSGLTRQLAVFGSQRGGELVLSAPIEGVVASMHATLGETASPDDSVFIITDPSKVWVRGNVPELELSRVKVGGAVIVRLHAFPEVAMRGVIAHAAPALDERTRSLPITVRLDAPDPRLRSGLFGTVELVSAEAGAQDERPIVVPVDALATIEGQSVVFVPVARGPALEHEANTFTPRSVLLGRRAAGFVEVREGLAEGDAIAISGAFTLKSALQSAELVDDHGH